MLLFDLPAVERKKVTADFAGGLISSDGGLDLVARGAAPARPGRGAGGLHPGLARPGERKTPGAFGNACSRFIYLENILET